jgi:hypothetical protein
MFLCKRNTKIKIEFKNILYVFKTLYIKSINHGSTAI